MKSYFFIPASRLRKLADVKNSSVDEIIIDFEDAILNSELETYFNEIKEIENIASCWFRVPLRNDFNERLNLDFIKKFHQIGVELMVLPKIKSADELVGIVHQFKNIYFIILIEHPRLLLEIGYAFRHHPEIMESIRGIGLGSHDLMTFLNAKHLPEHLDYPRKGVLYLAKAYGLQAIDIASMDIFNEVLFLEEVEYAKNNGYDAKFIIHPKQLEWLKQASIQDEKLYKWAESIIAHLPQNYKGGSIEPFVLNDEVIEKPHVLRAMEIIKNKKHGK